MVLTLVFKFQVVNIHGVPVLDAHFLQPGKKPRFAIEQILREVRHGAL